MNPTILSILTGLITSGVISSIVVAIFERRKRKVEGDAIIAEAARALVQPLTQRIDDLEADRTSDQKKIAALEMNVNSLTAQLISKDRRIAALEADRKSDQVKITALESDVKSRDEQIARLSSEVEELRKQLEDLGQKPRRKPTGELRA